MKPFAHLLICALGVTAMLPQPADAQSRVDPRRSSQQQTDQNEARREMRAGNTMKLREIEAIVLPMMRDAEYLGPAYDPVAMAYRLKFIRDGRVLFVDVDARTGRILRRSR